MTHELGGVTELPKDERTQIRQKPVVADDELVKLSAGGDVLIIEYKR